MDLFFLVGASDLYEIFKYMTDSIIVISSNDLHQKGIPSAAQQHRPEFTLCYNFVIKTTVDPEMSILDQVAPFEKPEPHSS